MTVERGQEAGPLDPLASQRTELIGQLAGAQLALEAVIAELSRNGGDVTILAELRNQIVSVIDLRQHVGSASRSELASIRREVASVTAASQTLAQHAASSGSAVVSHPTMTHQQAHAAIQSVSHDLFDRHVLDPYLQFASEEDERAYRRREQENAEALKRALALNTPAGSLHAAAILERQLDDAEAHGAGASPEFAALRERNNQARLAISAAQQAGPGAAKPKPEATELPASAKEADLSEAVAALKAAGVSTLTTPEHAPRHGMALAANAARAEPNAGRA